MDPMPEVYSLVDVGVGNGSQLKDWKGKQIFYTCKVRESSSHLLLFDYPQYACQKSFELSYIQKSKYSIQSALILLI